MGDWFTPQELTNFFKKTKTAEKIFLWQFILLERSVVKLSKIKKPLTLTWQNTSMEHKIENMEKHMNYLYDELDAREK